MSSNFNDMERMFAEGLQNYEVTPPAHVWSNIQKRKRKGLMLYKWRIAAILLLLCIAGTSAYYFMDKNNEQINSGAVTNSNGKTNADLGSDKNAKLNTENTGSVDASDKNGSNNTEFSNPTPIIKKSQHQKLDKIRKTNTDIVKSKEKVSKDIITENTTELVTKDFLFTMISKDKIKLRYIMYPSLLRYVYTTKRSAKKLYTPKEDDDKTKPVSKFSIEIGGGPTYAYRTLSGDGSLLRNESEKANVGLLTAIKINYHINTKWSVQSGLSLETRNESINYKQTEIKDKLTETPRQVTVFHPVLPPHTITVIDSSYSKENVNYDFNTTNRYQTINIPLVLGYNFTIGKLQYRISAGPVFNVYSMNTANNLVRINDKIELAPYKESAKIISSAYTAFALQYPLNQNYAWITEISYYTNLNNRLNSEVTLNQKNSGFNLFTGFKFNLIK